MYVLLLIHAYLLIWIANRANNIYRALQDPYPVPRPTAGYSHGHRRRRYHEQMLRAQPQLLHHLHGRAD